MLKSILSITTRPIDPYQFAYKAKRSTRNAISCLVQAINSHLDKECKGSETVFLDISNALNTLSRQGLLYKFAATPPPYWLVKLVHFYFIGCSQYIWANNKVLMRSQTTVVFLKVLFFPLRTFDLFAESLASFLKYDLVIGHPCRDPQSRRNHIKVSYDIAARILADNQHQLYEELSKARSYNSTRSRFNCFPRRLLSFGTLFYWHCHGCWLTES